MYVNIIRPIFVQEIKNKVMSRFKKGQTVWKGRGEKARKMIVAKAHNNPLIPVYQYTFEAPYDGFACGEQSLRSTEHGPDLKMRDCFKKDHAKENASRVNTIASALRQVVSEETSGLRIPNLSTFDNFRVDFKPDLKLTKWLTHYANGRMFIHVGSGQGHLVNMLKMSGARAVGIEPNIDKEEWIKWRITRDGANIDVNEILEGGVERYASLINALGKDKAILIIARPKNMDFVKTTYEMMPKGMELLYVTEVGVNLIAKPCELLEHEGISEDNEVIYSLTK